MSSLEKGDGVRGKESVQGPDHEEIDIGGWRGRVEQLSETEKGEPLLTIRWDSVTLNQLP